MCKDCKNRLITKLIEQDAEVKSIGEIRPGLALVLIGDKGQGLEDKYFNQMIGDLAMGTNLIDNLGQRMWDTLTPEQKLEEKRKARQANRDPLDDFLRDLGIQGFDLGDDLDSQGDGFQN